jgi:pantoate--beta-alanine ligase
MHRGRRFAGAALFVGEDDEMRLLAHDLIFSPGASKRPREKFIRGCAGVQRVRDREELASALAELRRGGTLALVPTMGALHAGHMALIQEAKRRADKVAATIFVNPTQFNDKADLQRYPRMESDDARKLEAAGSDLLWAPAVEDIYPEGFATTVHVAGISERWEGEHRPGHFDGVATVVAKLLLCVRPDVALFGEKDFQQLAVIRRMAADLNLGAEIVGVPTVRDSDDLALSSRNAQLSQDERARAVALPDALKAARDAIRNGAEIAQALRAAKQSLVDAGFLRIDYVALVDAATLEPLDAPRGEMRLIAAAVIGTTRLIDNIAVEMDASGTQSPRR